MTKKALIVGINEYSQAGFNLRGCLNDAESLSSLLVDVYNFDVKDVARLINSDATKGRILQGLKELVIGASAGDTIIFGFSGHGTQITATTSNESDSKDECIVPFEADFKSLITDNELHDIIMSNVDPTVNFTAIYDCCHSGSMFRELSIDSNGLFYEESINRCIDIERIDNLPKRDFGIAPYNVLSACRDDETAADLRSAGIQNVPRGAFSYAIHDFLRSNRDQAVALAEPQITARIRSVSKHGQTPVYNLVDSTKPLILY